MEDGLFSDSVRNTTSVSIRFYWVGIRMPNLLPRAALEGAGTALMEKFALPSERKAIAQLAEMQGAYNTSYSLQNIGKDLGQELGGADDILSSAMNARLGDGAATLGRHAPETQGLVEKIWSRIQSFSKPAAVAGAGLGAAELVSPDTSEAAPKIKLTPQLLDEAGTVVKDLLKSKGPVEFDISRRWWGKRVGSGGLFWDRQKDDQKFLSWVAPYIEEAKRIDPKAGAQAEKWIEIGKREPNSPKYYELALQTLHRPITHESAGANAVTDMMGRFGADSTREALLRSAPSEATKEALGSTLDYWKYLVGLAGTGLAGLGLGGNEAEAAPKIPIPINASKALRKGLGEGGLKGLLNKVEELVPRPNYRMENKVRTLNAIAEGKMGIESSASKFLKGMDLMGKQVAEVRKGNGNWRYIVFEDGTYLPIDKKYIASLSSSEGEKLYGQMFDMSAAREQKLMLGRSGAIANARGIPNKTLKESLATRKTLLEDLGEEAPSRVTTLLGGRNKDLPEPYAWGVMKYGDQGKFNRRRLAPPREPSVRIKDFLAPSFKETPPGRKLAAEALKVKSPLEKSIFNLEKAKSTKGISQGDEYMLRRFKGMSEDEASKGLRLVSQSSIERMVLRILGESK